jgi:hypothetical protein
MLATLQPTKEQVRAYMLQRQREFERRHADDDSRDGARADIDLLSTSTLFLPGTIAQLATLLAVEWCFLAAGISRPN